VAERLLRILQVNTRDIGGGAESVARNLLHAYQACGFPSWFAVGRKRSHDPHTILVPNDDCHSLWADIWFAIGNTLLPLVGRVRGVGRLRQWLGLIRQPGRLVEINRGHEDFQFPGTLRILELPPLQPDIVHCHNLHGDYFDLRALPWLTQQVPVVLTLHDAWLLSGHCAHSFGCERWKTGCGHCPDLTIYPAIRRDATAYNWQRKREIFGKSRIYLATPSRWLMQKVEQSILAPSIVEARVVHNGVDLSVFHPADREVVRTELGIPMDARVVLFTANGIRRNMWKDYQTLRIVVGRVAECIHEQKLLFIALGENASPEHIGGSEICFVPYQNDQKIVARYYQAADVYVHPARADTFPNTVIEALACGTPVVATAVGGIPEQIKSIGQPNYSLDEATGVLVPLGDGEAMAEAIVILLTNTPLREQLAENAVKDARKRFDLKQQVKTYLEWYQAIVESWDVGHTPGKIGHIPNDADTLVNR